MEPDESARAISELPPNVAAKILNAMGTKDQADTLACSDRPLRQAILSQLPEKEKEAVLEHWLKEAEDLHGRWDSLPVKEKAELWSRMAAPHQQALGRLTASC